MPTPEFILRLREKVGHERLWLSGVTAVVLRGTETDPEVLLVQRSDDYTWTPVSGIVDPGEQPHLAAVREVAEETGVTAAVENLIWLTVTDVVTYDNGDQTEYIDHIFRCAWVAGEPAPGDDEAVQAGFFPVDALPPMAARHVEAITLALAKETATRLGPLA